LAFLFLLLCDRILKQHEKNEKEKKAIGEPIETTTDDVMTMKKGDLTRKELKQFDGKSDDKKPFLLLACKGTIFDVTKGRDFYGPGGPYNCFCGKDASLAFAKVSTSEEHMNANCSNLFAMEVDALNDWYRKFEEKYPVVGKVRDSDFKAPKKRKKTKASSK
jgi:membrane-associated progesterone receptor component